MPRANRQADDDPRTRVCITLNKEVLTKGKLYAESQGRSFSNLVERLILTVVKAVKHG